MTITQQGILQLLKSAITGEAFGLSPDFSMSEAYALARRHHIGALVYQGAVNCGISRREDPMPKLLQRTVGELMVSEKQLSALTALFDAFDAAGIDYLPVKGIRMKGLYPKPELRTMSDADVLIRLEQYNRIRPILEAQGYREVVESDHELIWERKELHLELHKRLIPSYNPDLCGYFDDAWAMAARERGHRFALRAEDEWLYIFTHMAKHYRDGGIGLRHFTDLYIFRRAHPQMDGAYIYAALEQLELTAFYSHTCRLLDYWFEGAAGDPLLEMMTEFVFGSGSFGTADNHTVSNMLRRVENSRVSNGQLLYLWNMVFPGKKAMESQYPVLVKLPWLRPFVWLLRPFHRLCKNPKLLRKKRETLQTISEANIEARRRSLALVGLDFRF